jgi:hypothetical protein
VLALVRAEVAATWLRAFGARINPGKSFIPGDGDARVAAAEAESDIVDRLRRCHQLLFEQQRLPFALTDNVVQSRGFFEQPHAPAGGGMGKM